MLGNAGAAYMSLVELFSALADPTRCRVVEMLHDKPRPVHELAAAFAISRPAISRHLRVLKDAGLVQEEKAGRENVYSLQRGKLKPLQDWLAKHRAAKAAAKKPARPKVVAEIVVASAAAPEPAPPKRSPRRPVTVPRPAAPQLSFFDL
jgi:DNA-binding transcriptional ArsR family regulator